jgi:ABC-2 type transport system ATP-binding protein
MNPPAASTQPFWDLIYDLAAEGVTILVTTHYMDEAEYCGRVGIMRDGKLLAMDTPLALKEHYVPGDVWEIYAEPLLAGLDALSAAQGVARAGLAGDHLRVIVERSLGEKEIKKILEDSKVRVASIQKGEPSLEDVFLALAKG